MLMQGQHGHLSAEQKQLAFRLHAHGWQLTDIAREIGCTAPMVGRMVREHRHVDGHPFGWEPRAGCLSIREREQILLGIGRGESLSAIARTLGRSPSTITREVNANGGCEQYSAWRAHERAREQARRPKPCKLGRGKLAREVTRRLERLWSPEEISRRLPLDYPDEPEMRVSHETIYQSLFVQGRGELRRELARCLRSGRTARRPHGRVERRGRLPGMVMISERPVEADDRAVPGHWEGDIILGENGRSAVGTLVERTTRLLLLLHLNGDRSAEAVDTAMRKAIKTLPKELWRSITWDQGAEMAKHSEFTVQTDIPIYFCDPHSPWQRGSNENTNGLLRQYLPKGMDLSTVSAGELWQIQRSLNGRPRKTLGYLTPSEKFAELVATTG
jgi:transposase, IS30 family